MVHKATMNEDAQMKIRLPKVLKDQIEEAARESNRSLNGEIISRLEASFTEALSTTAGTFARRAMKQSSGNDHGERLDDLENRLKVLENLMIPDFTKEGEVP
jgi:Arc-like DNA binding domain